MRVVRYFLRNFTAMAVQEHLRSQVEDTSGYPKLTPKEIEDGSLDWGRFLSERPNS